MADIQDDVHEQDNDVTAPSITDDANDSLLTLSFNQDGGCLAIGTAHGFRICNVSPYQETFRRSFDSRDGGGGIGSIEMLFRCNLLALVGGGTCPQFPPNKVLIWDDHLGRPIGELSFRQKILAVRLRRDRICVALRDRVYVYNFGNLALLDTIITGGEKNGVGLLSISTDTGGNMMSNNSGEDHGMVLACPSVQRGQVRVELYGMRKNILIDAHESPLAALTLSVDGSLLATASERGTIIRLFETGKKPKVDTPNIHESSPHPPGTPLREFRRGVEHAAIGCLSFSLDRMWLACASDRETVHIFKVYDEEVQHFDGPSTSRQPKTLSKPKSKSSLSFASKYAKKILPSVLTKAPKRYLPGEQSFAQVRGGITNPQICAFVPEEPYTIAVAGRDDCGNGCLMLANFSAQKQAAALGSHGSEGTHQNMKYSPSESKGARGEAKRIAFHRFFKKGKDRNKARKQKSTGAAIENGQTICSDEGVTNVGDLADGMEQLEYKDSDGFVSIATENDAAKGTPHSVDEVKCNDDVDGINLKGKAAVCETTDNKHADSASDLLETESASETQDDAENEDKNEDSAANATLPETADDTRGATES